ncbi:MAG: hypothetical protein JSW08_00110, partial [archaeon]
FDNNTEALNYIKEWSSMPPLAVDFFYSELLNENQHSDIIVVLIKTEVSSQGDHFKFLKSLVCINGSLTESSKQINI